MDDNEDVEPSSEQSIDSNYQPYDYRSSAFEADPNFDEKDARNVKVVVIGESNVGKSSLTLRFVTNTFISNMRTTIGASYLVKDMICPNMQTSAGSKGNYQALRFNLWDTAGQERYRTLASLYYRGVDCALVVYDISDKNSFEQIKLYWLDELKKQASPDTKVCIVGNKSDLASARKVSHDEGKAYAQANDAAFVEASAKSGENVHAIFLELAKMLPAGTSDGASSKKDRYKLKVDDRAKHNGCC